MSPASFHLKCRSSISQLNNHSSIILWLETCTCDSSPNSQSCSFIIDNFGLAFICFFTLLLLFDMSTHQHPLQIHFWQSTLPTVPLHYPANQTLKHTLPCILWIHWPFPTQQPLVPCSLKIFFHTITTQYFVPKSTHLTRAPTALVTLPFLPTVTLWGAKCPLQKNVHTAELVLQLPNSNTPPGLGSIHPSAHPPHTPNYLYMDKEFLPTYFMLLLNTDFLLMCMRMPDLATLHISTPQSHTTPSELWLFFSPPHLEISRKGHPQTEHLALCPTTLNRALLLTQTCPQAIDVQWEQQRW
jgi:hypothetical protein